MSHAMDLESDGQRLEMFFRWKNRECGVHDDTKAPNLWGWEDGAGDILWSREQGCPLSNFPELLISVKAKSIMEILK